jgi:hypothetical protein
MELVLTARRHGARGEGKGGGGRPRCAMQRREKERRGRRGVGSRTVRSGWLWAALSNATGHAHGGGRLANRGKRRGRGRRGTGATDRRGRAAIGPRSQWWGTGVSERESEAARADMRAWPAQCRVARFENEFNDIP